MHQEIGSGSASSKGSGGSTSNVQSLQPSTSRPSSTGNNLTLEPSPTTRLPSQSRDADTLKLLIMRVQAALYSKGFLTGAIDGTLSTETRQALRMFQLAHGISATVTMTTPTLDSQGVRL